MGLMNKLIHASVSLALRNVDGHETVLSVVVLVYMMLLHLLGGMLLKCYKKCQLVTPSTFHVISS